MKTLILGDIVGRAGRQAALEALPKLKREHALDLIIVDVDNAAGGFGTNPGICEEFIEAGADALTGGDHIWDQKEIKPYISREPRLLRPANYPDSVPGKGILHLNTQDGKNIIIIHLLGQVFLRDNLNCPFACADKLLEPYRLGANADAIFVDFHAEATSEKMAMGLYLDGRVSAVVGTHTHVPTADAKILPGGTAYQTDLGMCGDYNSVIGFNPDVPMSIFLNKMRKSTGKMTPANQDATLCGAIIETGKDGKAVAITPLQTS